MRKTLSSLMIALMLGWVGVAGAGDLQKGAEAYGAGDYATAFREFSELAEQGNSIAQLNLGLMYSMGQGVARNNTEAKKWYHLAAEQGLVEAQFELATWYHVDSLGKVGIEFAEYSSEILK